MPKTKMQKCIYGILSVPFVLLQYWKAVLASVVYRKKPEKKTKKERKQHCGSFAISIGMLLLLISLQSEGDFMLLTLLIALLASLFLLNQKKAAEMMGLAKDSLAAGLLFTVILPGLAFLLLYYKGWLWAAGLFMIILLTTGAVKLLHIMSQDFCENYVASIIKKLLSAFLDSVLEWVQACKEPLIENAVYEPICDTSGYLFCKSAVQKRE